MAASPELLNWRIPTLTSPHYKLNYNNLKIKQNQGILVRRLDKYEIKSLLKWKTH